jgi:acetyl esterase/lipase
MTDPSDPKSSRKVHSPFYLAGPDFPPTFLAWGSADPQIKPRQSRVFVERLKELGVECVGVELEGALHWWAEKDFVESRPGNEYWEKAIEPGLKFVIDKLDRSRA